MENLQQRLINYRQHLESGELKFAYEYLIKTIMQVKQYIASKTIYCKKSRYRI